MKKYYSREIYIVTLILTALSIIFSEFTLSISLILLSLNYIISGYWKNIKKNPQILIIPSILIIELLGLIYTSDLEFGLTRISKRLPLYLLPIIIGSSPVLNKKETKIILLLFVAGLIVQSFISLSIYFKLVNYEWNDIRDISIYISHIRLSLMLVLGQFILVFYFINDKEIRHKLGYIFAFIIISFFLYVLNSLTGIIAFFISALIIFSIEILKNNSRKIRSLYFISVLVIIAVIGLLINYSVNRFYDFKEYPRPLPEKTVNGNKYMHKDNLFDRSNGYKVWNYVCKEELESEWKKRTGNSLLETMDKKNQWLYATACRYMTSKGLKKDSAGLSMLEKEDIKNIEKGITNIIYTKPLSIYSKIYPIIWQIDFYVRGGNPEGHSITLRLEYLKTTFHIIKNNLLIVVGSGDSKIEFENAYQEMDTKLRPEFRKRAHNQYLTFILNYGIIGFTIIILLFGIAIKKGQGFKDYFFIVHFTIITLSMLNEDTLETHTGVCLIAFWLSFFLYGKTKQSLIS